MGFSPDFADLIKKALENRWAKPKISEIFTIPFRSEYDLQFCLASELEKEYKNAIICLEYTVGAYRHRIDIVIILDGKKYAIELKYGS